ncbi:MAG: pyruvate ferredoxin oxidoreductase [archaeon]
MNKKIALSGGEAVAFALKQINPEVMAMYPITPQTPIIEAFARYEANGEVDTEIIRVESEHSALSAVVGAQACGVRAVTATSSQGLLYMYEVLSVASGFRLPILMPIVNRAISAPINIHCDHSDSMSCLDQGWMQVYCENAQEAYEMTLFSLRLAESVNLPIMVCQDGFITSHNVTGVEVFDNKKVKEFIKEYKPEYNLLDTKKPISIGSLVLPDTYFEIRVNMFNAFAEVKSNYSKISIEFNKLFNKKINIYEDYFANNSEIVIIVLSSTAEATKDVIDKLRKEKRNVGLLRPILYRPFLYDDYAQALKKAKKIIVLERSEGPGSYPPVYKDIMITLARNKINAEVYSYVFGLGGRDIYEKDIEKLIIDVSAGKAPKNRYIGLKG